MGVGVGRDRVCALRRHWRDGSFSSRSQGVAVGAGASGPCSEEHEEGGKQISQAFRGLFPGVKNTQHGRTGVRH